MPESVPTPISERQWIGENIEAVRRQIADLGIYAFFDYLEDLQKDLPDDAKLKELLDAVGGSIKSFQNELAKEYNEVKWWNKRGVKILKFLIDED